MVGGFDKDRTIGDYAVFLQALLPGFMSFYCHDRRGYKFFAQQSAEDIDFTLEYDDALKSILADPDQVTDNGRVDLDNAAAYIVPFTGDEERVLGVFSVLVHPDHALPYGEMADLIHPVVCSLQRELSLRYRLMVAYKKLNVRSAEENLLHQVEKLVHLHRASEDTLTHILLLCRKFLKVGGAMLMVPDKHIRIFEGDTLKPVEARLLLSNFVDNDSTGVGYHVIDAADNVTNSEEMDLLAVPIRQNSSEPIGIFALSGWESTDFSMRRRRRIGRYVAAHIEDVVARDYDSLTGLMSWALFERKLVTICSGSDNEPARNDENFMLSFDIDRLHVVNENLGPERGDEMLAAFAGLLRERLGKQIVTRVESDSFAAFLVDTDMDKARDKAEEILNAFGEMQFMHGSKKERASVSIGVGPVSGEPSTASAALAPAQVACKAAKDRGRGRVETYQQDDKSIIQRMDDIQLVGDIRGAIENGRLSVFGQPIVPLNDNTGTSYFEVLVRLLDSAGRHVLPAEFFSSAERYQLMEELDRWVISETLSLLSSHNKYLSDGSLRIAINLSGQSLGSEHFLQFVKGEIEKFQVPPEMLCFEITETVAIANLQRAQTFMHSLKKLGCTFSLDDFGTGLSSFAYLKLFPVDTLKIDGSFVQDITTNVVSQSVVAAISEVARVMELDTVAEYVQGEEALELLRDLGVTYGQGFLLGEPEPLQAALGKLGHSAAGANSAAIAAPEH